MPTVVMFSLVMARVLNEESEFVISQLIRQFLKGMFYQIILNSSFATKILILMFSYWTNRLL